MSPELPPKEEIEGKQVRLRASLWGRIKAIADAEGRSLNEVASFFLEWATDDYEQAKARKSERNKK